MHTQIVELQFILLQLLEKDIITDNQTELSLVDSYVARIDAFFSLAIATDTF